MIFKQLIDYETFTYTYILADEKTKDAIIIDSVKENSERDANLIKELGLNLKYLLETHVHADHITGVANLKKHFPNAKSATFSDGGAPCSDMHLTDGQKLEFGKETIEVISTPGHTNGCTSYHTNNFVFTGDTLLIRGTGRTDFQQGSSEKLYDSITKKLFTLPDETIVYPGHDYKGMTSSTIGEEKINNPRVGNGKKLEDFMEIMENLNLPHPKKIAESVPANLQCGNIS